MYQNLVRYLKRRAFYIWLFVFSFWSFFISPESSTPYAIFGTFIFYYLLYSYHERLFSVVISFITVTLAVYYPISLYYGSLNSGMVAAFLETSVSESLEFIQKISLSHLMVPLFYILCAVVLLRLKKYHQRSPIDKKKRMMQRGLCLVFAFTLVFAPTQFYFTHASEDEETRWTLANSPINSISFYVNIYDSVRDYVMEKAALEQAASATPPWQIQSVSPTYRNYVLIIGESARRDYLSTYGFSLPTTPFLDQTKGYINSGYISAAPATYHSLLKSLYFKKEKKVDYRYNIITLAKAANIETNWLSNQGSIGKYDTMASRIGASADFFYFTKKGGFNTGNNEDDVKLVEQLKARLASPPLTPARARLFVLHLMGSHQDFCQRIQEHEKKLTFVNEKMSCYVNSILKTDTLIQEVVQLLKEKNEPYSLIYFSDHGLNHIEKENPSTLNLDYDVKFKSNYEVPFVKLASDDRVRNLVNVKRSAVNFMYGFAQWLNITTQELDPYYDFFSQKDDEHIKAFNFEKHVDFDELVDDPITF